MGESSLPFHGEIIKYLDSHPDIKMVFQPGTFQMKFGAEKLANVYEKAHLFFCNVQEAQHILDSKESDVKVLLKEMNKLGPKIVCITDGPRGAYSYDSTAREEANMWFMPIYPDPAPPYDRTGAGDAFSSTFAIALALGKSVPEALSWGPINSMSVVQKVGAQAGLLKRSELEAYLARAPVGYAPEVIS
jgi:sugar/nucleoside kinase (ribokinase family)